jgi:multidrug efflux pump
VALSVPLVLAITFVGMLLLGIDFQRISLGALIIALGLLVDDAMISVEMMVARREAGDTLEKAAIFAYSSTAFPMLTGTLVTVAGFVPIGLNGSSAGEYTFTLFAVIAAALLISWIVAVLFAPLLGVTLLPRTVKAEAATTSRFKDGFRRMLVAAMRWRWLTIGSAVVLFGLSVFGLQFMQQQFFPAADRPEVLVDMTLPQDASIAETRLQMDRFEAILSQDKDIVRWSSYVGRGAVRFYLPLDEQLANPFFGQIVIVTRDVEARDRVISKLHKFGREQFIGTDASCTRSISAPRSVGRCSTASAGRTSRPCARSPRSSPRSWRRTGTSAASSTTGTSPVRCCASASIRTGPASSASARRTSRRS